ncbi:MAG: ABC transporter substrate-binding protein [Nostoc sp. S4]|nr:ABC transporter substrate-binding protein [Nostoc sp. S4]
MVQSPSSPQFPQNVAVVIRINVGNFADGFPVLLQILEDGKIIQEYDDLDIPAAPEMPQLYQQWREISLRGSRALQAVPGQETNVSYADWRQRTTDLRDYCRTWFRHSAFRSLRDRILANQIVHTDQSVPIIIRCFTISDTENDILRRLPWHLWDLFSENQLPNAEFALFTRFRRRVAILKAPIRVLAIFGSSDRGLQLEQDEAALQILEKRGAKITRKLEPSIKILSDELRDKNWDILFFAGHSYSEGNSGTIQISQGNSLPLDALRHSLTTAVTRGLKLAIFNSCDGLGIADFLTELNVPVEIVMREPVPDRIAGQFLLNFLREFSQGTPLCLAVRKARESLEAIELHDFPAASWLPVICVNPNQPELVWPAPTLLLRLLSLLRGLLSNLRQFITRFLVSPARSLLSRLRSYFGRYYLIVLGFAAFTLVVIIAVASSITSYHCQIFPSICIDNFISYGEKPIANSKVKLRGKYLEDKQKGIEQFRQGKYEEAWKTFEKLHPRPENSRTDNSPEALAALQDPEILIYRNNAVVRNWHHKNPNEPIYTIAVAAPLNIDAGMGIFLGVAQAQDAAVNNTMIDNKPINNKPINLQVVIANDNNNPAQARRIADRLYQKDEEKILAVVGHYTSANTCAALNVYFQKPNPLVVISPTSSVVDLSSCDKDANIFFRTVSSTRVEAESLVEYLTKKLKKPEPKVVIIYNKKDLFSMDLFNQFKNLIEGKAYQGLVIKDFDNLSDVKFDPEKLPQEVINQADALVVLPDGQTNDNIAFNKAIDIIKWNKGKKIILGANTLYGQQVLNLSSKTTKDRLFLAVDWHPDQCGAKPFADQIHKYWGGDLNRRTALAYEAVQALLKAIELSNLSVDRTNIKRKLLDTEIENQEALKKVAALSHTIQKIIYRSGLQSFEPSVPISFKANGDRREITTRAIVTVDTIDTIDQNRKFVLDPEPHCSN